MVFFAQPANPENQGEHLEAIIRLIGTSFTHPILFIDDATGYGDSSEAQLRSWSWLDQNRDLLDVHGMTDRVIPLSQLYRDGHFQHYKKVLQDSYNEGGEVRDEINRMARTYRLSDTFQAHANAEGWHDIEKQRRAVKDAIKNMAMMFTVGLMFPTNPVIYSGPRPHDVTLIKQRIGTMDGKTTYPYLMSPYFSEADNAGMTSGQKRAPRP